MPVWGEGEYEVEFDFFQPDSGGLEGAFSPESSRITAPIEVAGEDWLFARRAIIGWPELVTADGVTYISRRLPLPYFDELRPSPMSDFWLYASNIARIEGLGPRGETETGCPVFDAMRMWVTFTSRSYTILPDNDPALVADAYGAAFGPYPDEATLQRYVSGPFWKPYSRQVTLRRGLMKSIPLSGDPSAPNTLTEGVARPESGATLTYIWHEVPAAAVPYRAIERAMNTVNELPFDGDKFAAQTLLFESPDIKFYQNAVGVPVADLQYTFRYLPRRAWYGPDAGTPRGWNWFLTYLKSATGKATPHYDYREYTLPAGDGAFFPTDFRDLFRPPQPS